MASTISIDKLSPHPKNGYYFTDVEGEKYGEIKRSVDVYGIRESIVVTTDYTVISGHQRLRIAKDLGLTDIPVEIKDVDEIEAEYLLIAYNIERRGEAEPDPIKKARIAKFLKEYWAINQGTRKELGQNGITDISEVIGETERTTKRLLKLNDLIPEIQSLVSSGKQGTTAAEQLAYLTEDEQREIYTLFGEELTKQTVEEVKRLRREIEQARDTEQALRDTIDSLRCQPEPEPKVIEKPVYQVREVVPLNIQTRLDDMGRRLEEAEIERDEAEASLAKTLVRLQELERIERSVNATKDSSLYNLYRSLAGANGYLSALSTNVSESSILIGEANQEIIDKLKVELTLISRLVGNVTEMIRTSRNLVVDTQEQKSIIEVIA